MCGAGRTVSIRNVKVVPRSRPSLAALTLPLCISTSDFTIDRPSPNPPKRRVTVRSPCSNGWNRRVMRSGSIPTPLSTTSIVTVPFWIANLRVRTV